MSDKVWAVTQGSYSDYRVLCICRTKEDAEAIVEKYVRLENIANTYRAQAEIQEFPLLDRYECTAKLVRYASGWAALRWLWDGEDEEGDVEQDDEDYAAAVRARAICQQARADADLRRKEVVLEDKADGLIVTTKRSERYGFETLVRDHVAEYAVQRHDTEGQAGARHVRWLDKLRSSVTSIHDLRTGRVVELQRDAHS